MQVISAKKVYQDSFLFDRNATYGVIGMGANSPLWQPYIDVYTNSSSYSIALARQSSQLAAQQV